MPITVAQICRYPIKGLNAEPLERVTLAAGQALPNDRRFAIAHGSGAASAESGAWQPRRNFLHLAKDEKLAQLRIKFDDESGEMVIERAGKPVVRGKITELTGRALLAQFFAGFMADQLRSAPRMVEAASQPYTDNDSPFLSIIGLASVADLERVVREPVDRRRFRANIYLEGSNAWEELGWAGKEIKIGGVRLRGEGRIDRCAATNVNPDSAARDLNIPLALQRGFGHVDMGAFARVVEEGDIALGDEVTLV